MAEFLLAAAALVLLTVAVGLLRLLRGPTDTDRIMAVQLLGTGVVAVLLLVAAALDAPAVIDVALVLALLAPFLAAAFAAGGAAADRP
ncbi:MAG: monovalent cation/H+ antiporter complex subunit F [Geminicoccaceae bacterium]